MKCKEITRQDYQEISQPPRRSTPLQERVTKIAFSLLMICPHPVVSHFTALGAGVYTIKTHLNRVFDSNTPPTQRAEELARTALAVAILVAPYLNPGASGAISLITTAVEILDLSRGAYSDFLQKQHAQAFEKCLRISIAGCPLAAACTGLPAYLFTRALLQTALCLPHAWRNYHNQGIPEAAVTGLIACVRLHQAQCAWTLLAAPPQKLPSISIPDPFTKSLFFETAVPPESMWFNAQAGGTTSSHPLEEIEFLSLQLGDAITSISLALTLETDFSNSSSRSP